MTNFHALGFLGGILLVAIAIAVMKKRKQTDRYDERQIASRGMAFKAGFATFLVCELGLFTAEIFLGKSIDIFSPGTLHFLVAMAAAMVFAVVSIFKDAYFPVGQKVSMRYFITLGAMAVLWSLLLFRNRWTDENGKLGLNVVFLATLVLIVSILISVLIRNLMIKSESEKDVD
ncbi:MAG: hypothetical protein IIU15_00470 [Treponema sp.]|nr:hypothetical protein [Treponema sp.]